MKRILFTIILALSLGTASGQSLSLSLTGASTGRVEVGLVVTDSVSSTSTCYVTSGLGWFRDPYVYIGFGLDLQMYRNLYLNTELYPIFSMEHRDWIDRGNNMIGDEFMFGTRIRVGPAYTIQLLPELDLLLKAGLEFECPVFATRNAAAQFQVRGYVGLGLILHTL